MLLDAPGVWTLSDLGYSDIVMAAGGGTPLPSPSGIPFRATPPVTYVLPDRAAQGPGIWYLINFHFEIEFQEDASGGRTEVSAIFNFSTSAPFGTAALIEFSPVMRDGALTVDWNSLGLTDGWQSGTAESSRAEVWFSNYLPNDAVMPGQNSLVFAVKEYGAAQAATIRVFNDTSIEATLLSPPSLAIDVASDWDPPARGGDTFDVPYTVKNLGGWPAKDVVAEVSYPADGLRLLGQRSVTTPLVEGSEEALGSFKFRALTAGVYSIAVKVQGRTGGSAQTAVTVTITGGEEVSRPRFWGLVALVLGVGALPLIPYGRLLGFTRRWR